MNSNEKMNRYFIVGMFCLATTNCILIWDVRQLSHDASNLKESLFQCRVDSAVARSISMKTAESHIKNDVEIAFRVDDLERDVSTIMHNLPPPKNVDEE